MANATQQAKKDQAAKASNGDVNTEVLSQLQVMNSNMEEFIKVVTAARVDSIKTDEKVDEKAKEKVDEKADQIKDRAQEQFNKAKNNLRPTRRDGVIVLLTIGTEAIAARFIPYGDVVMRKVLGFTA